MPPFSVGCIEYINAFPLHFPLKLKKIPSQSQPCFTFAIPAKLNELLRQQVLDIALTSSAACFTSEMEVLSGYGIAAENEILSVNLYTKSCPYSLDKARIGLTHHSATSSCLLKILCQQYWKIEPRFEPLNRDLPFSSYDAFLLIGDEALKNQTLPGFQTIDLGSAWHAMTQLPFVYALFSFKKGGQEKKIAHFQEDLNLSLQWSEEHQDEIEAEAQKQCALPSKVIRHYFSLLKYRLSKREMDGFNLFKHLSQDIHV